MTDKFRIRDSGHSVKETGRSLEIRVASDGSEYAHSLANKGMDVAVLGYFRDGHTMAFLGSYETRPAHDTAQSLYALSGPVGRREAPLEPAVRMLKDAGGYDVVTGARVYMGHMRPSAASDTMVHAFACDLSGLFPDRARPQPGPHCRPVSIKDVVASRDPVLHSLVLILSGHEDI